MGAALIPALAQGVGGAAAGAGINAAVRGGSGGGNFQAAALPVTQTGGATGNSTALTPQQQAQVDAIRAQNTGGTGGQLADQMAAAMMQQNGGPHLVMPTTGQDARDAMGMSQTGLSQQGALAQALAQAGGIQNQTNSYNNLGNLAGQYGDIAAGRGPNPAQAMLAQQTGNNIAQQGALMASQRGASQNAGLIARQAAQQGGALQQQAVGQGATMQANQQLGALGALGNIYGQQAGIAQNQIGNQAGVLNQFNTNAQGYQGQLLNALQGQNQVLGGQTANQNDNNTRIQIGNQTANNNLAGNLTGAVGTAMGNAFGGGGGNNSHASHASPAVTTPSGPTLGVNTTFDRPNFAHGGMAEPKSSFARAMKGLSASSPHMMAKGGQVPAMVSPGEKIIPPSQVEKVAKGEKSAIAAGKTVKGHAKVKGDSLKNDTVSKNLESGSIVLPRSVTQSKNPGAEAQKFVEALLKKKKS